jgi:cobalt-zinc-cadmium efflux system membrane fusion protein
LLSVSSPDVTNAIAAFRKARNRLDFETRSLERSKDLLNHRAIAQKDLESVQADFNDASTDLQNALQALRIFGITTNEIDAAEHQGVPINPELVVRSPIKGIVVQKLVFPGQLIQAGATTCFLISDPSTVWVQGHIYEKDLTSVHLGDPVEVTHSSLPGVLHGVISNIGAMIDPATRTTPVRIATANPKGLLKKDLFVNIVIQTKTQRGALTVPTNAVLYDADNLPFVYVQMDDGKFGQRQVTIGAQLDSKFEVLSGLKEGEKVIAEGAVFLQFANTFQR